jgi:hypothetical protein
MTHSGNGGRLPYGLVRLSDVINCSVAGLGTFCSQLMNELTQVGLHLHDTNDPHELIPAAKIERYTHWAKIWTQVADEFEFEHVNNCIDRLTRSLKSGKGDYRELEYGLKSIKDALNDGLRSQFAYRYPNSKMTVFKAWTTDWKSVFERFPDCKNDIHVGVDLWALYHHTASVFHMMRVLEVGLKALASSVDLKFTIENWQNIIDQIEAQIRLKQKSLPKGADKNKTLQFLAEAAKEFAYFKDGWRNYVSHNKIVYDEHQARSVMEHVRQFMTTLANGLPLSSEEESPR